MGGKLGDVGWLLPEWGQLSRHSRGHLEPLRRDLLRDWQWPTKIDMLPGLSEHWTSIVLVDPGN